MRVSVPWPARIAAGTVLLAGVALAGCGGGHHHVTGPTTTTTPANATTTTTTPTGPYQWSRAASPDLAIGGGPSSALSSVLAPGGSGALRTLDWLVAGTRLAADGSTTATVWTSLDTARWSAASLTGPQVDSQANAAARVRATTVIVGSVGSGGDQTAAVWVSAAAGAPFREVPATDLPSGTGPMTAVTGSGLGWFASGLMAGRATLWYSSNARNWSVLKAADGVIASATAPHIDALLATANGVFAGGWEQDGTHTDAAMWASNDGVNWHPVLTAASAFASGGDRVITALAAEGNGLTPTGYVAVGGVRTGNQWAPASWLSPDGASWSPPSTSFAGVVPAAANLASSGAVVRGVSVVPTGVTTSVMVAVGGGSGAQHLWRSTDGMQWSGVGLPAGAAAATADWRATQVATDGTRTLVVDGIAGQPHLLADTAGAWSEPSANPAVFGPVRPDAAPVAMAASPGGVVVAVHVDQPPQAIGAGTTATAFLTSADASTWELASSEASVGSPFAAASVAAVANSVGHVVAVGYRDAGGHRRAVAWLSRDARTWTGPFALDTRAVAGGDQAAGICREGTTWVAVGWITPPSRTKRTTEVRTAARAWTSTDGIHWRLAVVGAGPHPGPTSEMDGCVATRAGLDAYGLATATGQVRAAPAYWTATAPSAVWTPQSDSPIGGNPTPIKDVAGPGGASAPAWLAVGGGQSYPLSVPAVLAQSTNNGSSWQVLPTAGAPWQGAAPGRVDAAAWLAGIPVVAGSVDGRLAIWVGTPNG